MGIYVTREMNRLKGLYRSWAIPCTGRDVYYTRHRNQWLERISEAGPRRRAQRLCQQWDMLQRLRQQARRELLAEGRKHSITAKLRRIPSLGPIRSALAVALIHTPHRFRSKRQLWKYCGVALETPHPRRICLRARRTAAVPKAAFRSRSEQRSQSRSQQFVQSRGEPSQRDTRTASGVLPTSIVIPIVMRPKGAHPRREYDFESQAGSLCPLRKFLVNPDEVAVFD